MGASTLREGSHLCLVGLWCQEGGARPCCLFLSVLLPLGPRLCTLWEWVVSGQRTIKGAPKDLEITRELMERRSLRK